MQDNQELNQELQKQLELKKQVELLEQIAKKYLTKEAIARYGNVKAAHPKKALEVIAFIGQAAQTGQLKEKITDEKLKELLQQMQDPKKEFKITKR